MNEFHQSPQNLTGPYLLSFNTKLSRISCQFCMMLTENEDFKVNNNQRNFENIILNAFDNLASLLDDVIMMKYFAHGWAFCEGKGPTMLGYDVLFVGCVNKPLNKQMLSGVKTSAYIVLTR